MNSFPQRYSENAFDPAQAQPSKSRGGRETEWGATAPVDMLEYLTIDGPGFLLLMNAQNIAQVCTLTKKISQLQSCRLALSIPRAPGHRLPIVGHVILYVLVHFPGAQNKQREGCSLRSFFF